MIQIGFSQNSCRKNPRIHIIKMCVIQIQIFIQQKHDKNIRIFFYNKKPRQLKAIRDLIQRFQVVIKCPTKETKSVENQIDKNIIHDNSAAISVGLVDGDVDVDFDYRSFKIEFETGEPVLPRPVAAALPDLPDLSQLQSYFD